MEIEEKITEMQKYIPCLNTLIDSLKRDPLKDQQVRKMQLLMDMLNRKVANVRLETLIKCEGILMKVYGKDKYTSSGSANDERRHREEKLRREKKREHRERKRKLERKDGSDKHSDREKKRKKSSDGKKSLEFATNGNTLSCDAKNISKDKERKKIIPKEKEAQNTVKKAQKTSQEAQSTSKEAQNTGKEAQSTGDKKHLEDVNIKLLEDDKVKLENDKVKLENDKVKLEDDKVKLEDDKVKLEDGKVKLEDDKVKLEDDKVKLEDAADGHSLESDKAKKTNTEESVQIKLEDIEKKEVANAGETAEKLNEDNSKVESNVKDEPVEEENKKPAIDESEVQNEPQKKETVDEKPAQEPDVSTNTKQESKDVGSDMDIDKDLNKPSSTTESSVDKEIETPATTKSGFVDLTSDDSCDGTEKKSESNTTANPSTDNNSAIITKTLTSTAKIITTSIVKSLSSPGLETIISTASKPNESPRVYLIKHKTDETISGNVEEDEGPPKIMTIDLLDSDSDGEGKPKTPKENTPQMKMPTPKILTVCGDKPMFTIASVQSINATNSQRDEKREVEKTLSAIVRSIQYSTHHTVPYKYNAVVRSYLEKFIRDLMVEKNRVNLCLQKLQKSVAPDKFKQVKKIIQTYCSEPVIDSNLPAPNPYSHRIKVYPEKLQDVMRQLFFNENVITVVGYKVYSLVNSHSAVNGVSPVAKVTTVVINSSKPSTVSPTVNSNTPSNQSKASSLITPKPTTENISAFKTPDVPKPSGSVPSSTENSNLLSPLKVEANTPVTKSRRRRRGADDDDDDESYVPRESLNFSSEESAIVGGTISRRVSLQRASKLRCQQYLALEKAIENGEYIPSEQQAMTNPKTRINSSPPVKRAKRETSKPETKTPDKKHKSEPEKQETMESDLPDKEDKDAMEDKEVEEDEEESCEPPPEIDTSKVNTGKNINRAYHCRSNFLDRCLICHDRSNSVVSHYVNTHRDREVFVSRLTKGDITKLQTQTVNFAFLSAGKSATNTYVATCIFCRCQRTANLRSWLEHFTLHTGEYGYECTKCSKRRPKRQQATRHVNFECKSEKPKFKIIFDLEKSANSIDAYVCLLCNYIQLQHENLISHLNTEHELTEGITDEHYRMVNLLSVTRPYYNEFNQPIDNYGNVVANDYLDTQQYVDAHFEQQKSFIDGDDMSFMICNMLATGDDESGQIKLPDKSRILQPMETDAIPESNEEAMETDEVAESKVAKPKPRGRKRKAASAQTKKAAAAKKRRELAKLQQSNAEIQAASQDEGDSKGEGDKEKDNSTDDKDSLKSKLPNEVEENKLSESAINSNVEESTETCENVTGEEAFKNEGHSNSINSVEEEQSETVTENEASLPENNKETKKSSDSTATSDVSSIPRAANDDESDNGLNETSDSGRDTAPKTDRIRNLNEVDTQDSGNSVERKLVKDVEEPTEEVTKPVKLDEFAESLEEEVSEEKVTEEVSEEKAEVVTKKIVGEITKERDTRREQTIAVEPANGAEPSTTAVKEVTTDASTIRENNSSIVSLAEKISQDSSAEEKIIESTEENSAEFGRLIEKSKSIVTEVIEGASPFADKSAEIVLSTEPESLKDVLPAEGDPLRELEAKTSVGKEDTTEIIEKVISSSDTNVSAVERTQKSETAGHAASTAKSSDHSISEEVSTSDNGDGIKIDDNNSIGIADKAAETSDVLVPEGTEPINTKSEYTVADVALGNSSDVTFSSKLTKNDTTTDENEHVRVDTAEISTLGSTESKILTEQAISDEVESVQNSELNSIQFPSNDKVDANVTSVESMEVRTKAPEVQDTDDETKIVE